jgi:hypothetical protein
LNYEEFCRRARRLIDHNFELVEYESRTYIHLGVPRVAEKNLWNGDAIRL